LELQLLEAKVKHQTQIAVQEAAKTKTQVEMYETQIASLSKTEKELRGQLSLYAEKFEQFQETLMKSNDVFNTFKLEMERMSRTIKKSEKENVELKKKCDQTDIALIDLAEERNLLRKQLETTKVQKKKLEDLCRAMQQERKNILLQQQQQQQQQQQSQLSIQLHPRGNDVNENESINGSSIDQDQAIQSNMESSNVVVSEREADSLETTPIFELSSCDGTVNIGATIADSNTKKLEAKDKSFRKQQETEPMVSEHTENKGGIVAENINCDKPHEDNIHHDNDNKNNKNRHS